MGAMIILVLSVLVAALPLLGVALVVWWLDRYEREPPWAIILAFGWGAVGAAVLAGIVNSIFNVGLRVLLERPTAMDVTAVLFAPAIEEGFKGAALLGLLLLPRLVDTTIDGIVYGSMTGLGFAVTENISYFVSSGDEGPRAFLGTVIMRTLFTASVHLLASATLGAAVGFARQRRGGPAAMLTALLLGFAGAVAIHTTWNLLQVLTRITQDTGFSALGCLFVVGALAVYFTLGQVVLWFEGRSLLRELHEEEVYFRLLPPGHAVILASTWARASSHWLPPHIDRPAYIHLATRLGLAKAAHRHAPTPAQEHEIQGLRAAIQHVLTGGK